MKEEKYERGIRQTRFPVFLFAVVFGVLLLMSGIHVGLIVWVNKIGMNKLGQILIPLIYWALVAGGLTLYTRYQMKKTYEIPMQTLAKATSRVAHGDFSVFVPTINTPDKWDYLDIMIMDFNTMVEELGSMETLKTDFFSNVSHEFKTPLAVIYNNAQLLDKEELSEEKRKEYTQNILKSSKRLADLIMNMLKLNKLEKQTIQPAPERYDLCRQLCDCALQYEEVWERKNIEFEVDIEDRVMIEADTGCGMDEATIKHIYDKFFQGDTSHSTEGNGLGLSLVRRILQLSEGTISVESTVGKGSIFTVQLPLTPDDMENGSGIE